MSAEFISSRMPRPRKITLGIILSMAFTNAVLLVVTLVRPVPQFSSSGTLMTISARGNATLGRRSLFGTEGAPRDDKDANKQRTFIYATHFLITTAAKTSVYTPPISVDNLKRRRREHSDRQNEVEAGWYTPKNAKEENTRKQAEPSTRRSYTQTSDTNELYFPEEPTSSAFILPGLEHSSQAASQPVQTMAVPSQDQDRIVKVKPRPSRTGWVELWIGPLGVCIQRGNGTIACSTASITKTFLTSYRQAGLDGDIVARLPHHLKGCSVALLLAVLVYILCTAIFALTLSPPFSLLMRYGPTKSMDARHQASLALNTVLCTIALFLVLVPTFILRGMFLRTVDSVPAFDDNLTAKMGGAFAQLYACSILGGLILLQSIALVSEDLRKPWWFVYKTLRRNPFQTNTRGIDFTAHRQVRIQAEAQARAELEAQAIAEAARSRYGPESAYDDEDGMSRYDPTGIGASEVAPPGGSVFIPGRRARGLGRTATSSHYSHAFPPSQAARSYISHGEGSRSYPVIHRPYSGSIVGGRFQTGPGSPEFPAKGW